jgi:hypothetical protein
MGLEDVDDDVEDDGVELVGERPAKLESALMFGSSLSKDDKVAS